jgi:NAD(P)-dependent dehydrogenase (short-subunit alcohol dehydrogenase family)
VSCGPDINMWCTGRHCRVGADPNPLPNLESMTSVNIPAASPFDLTGHVALVTGGNSGIGLGMAEALVTHGATLAIWGTNPDKNREAAQRLVALSGTSERVVDLVCDVGSQEAVEASMAAVLERFGRIDSCFVNAGVGGQAPSFLEMTADEWRRVMRVNLDGAFYTAQAATRHMVERAEKGDTAGGSLIFTTSGSAYFGQQKGQHYGASKGGLISMMRAIAVEHARHGVRSNAVLPGWIESDMTSGALGWQKFVDKVLPRVPTRRWGVPADFGGLAVYLASQASSYHTGDVITIDGGYHSF